MSNTELYREIYDEVSKFLPEMDAMYVALELSSKPEPERRRIIRAAMEQSRGDIHSGKNTPRTKGS